MGIIFNSKIMFSISLFDDIFLVQDENNEEIPLANGVDYSTKHPLHNSWTMWYYEKDRRKVWGERQRVLTTVDTVEDFWR